MVRASLSHDKLKSRGVSRVRLPGVSPCLRGAKQETSPFSGAEKIRPKSRSTSGTNNLTQEDLAEAVGLNARHLQAIEAGDYWPTLPTLKALRKALKTSWETLCESW